MALTSFTVAQRNIPKAAASGAMPITILGVVITDHTAFMVHVYLLAGDVLATIAVGAGIVWEHGTPDVRAVANRLVIWGVVAETLCSVALFSFDETVSSAQQSKIIALETEIAPRKLTKEQYDALQSLKGRMSRINVSTETDWETWSFATQIAGALADAGIRAPIFVRRSYLAHTTVNMLYDRYAFSNPFGAPTRGEPLASVLKDAGLLIGGGIVDQLPFDLADAPKDDPMIIVGGKPPTENPFQPAAPANAGKQPK